MKLQSLLLITKRKFDSQPIALLVYKNQQFYQVQKVYYHPGILDLGVVLSGYYHNPRRVQQLFTLGDCLSVGHYLDCPLALKYGYNFLNNVDFQRLPSKQQKHLIQELQDGTIALRRDLHQSLSLKLTSHLRQLMSRIKHLQEIYYFHENRWLVMTQNHFISLNHVIQKKLNRRF